MITVELPKLYVDYVEILVAEELSVLIDVIFSLNVKHGLDDSSSAELSVGDTAIKLSVCPVHNAVDDA